MRSVSWRRYAKVSRSAFPALSGRKTVAVIRTSGAITGGSGGGVGGGGITPGEVVRQLRAARKNKNVAAVVLRIDSGGGDALASDIMWREIQVSLPAAAAGPAACGAAAGAEVWLGGA